MDDQNKILTYPKAQLLGSSRQKPINELMLQSLPAINTHRKLVQFGYKVYSVYFEIVTYLSFNHKSVLKSFIS
jgi:hypothetical protein